MNEFLFELVTNLFILQIQEFLSQTDNRLCLRQAIFTVNPDFLPKITFLMFVVAGDTPDRHQNSTDI